jgi:hypothetical protein
VSINQSINQSINRLLLLLSVLHVQTQHPCICPIFSFPLVDWYSDVLPLSLKNTCRFGRKNLNKFSLLFYRSTTTQGYLYNWQLRPSPAFISYQYYGIFFCLVVSVLVLVHVIIVVNVKSIMLVRSFPSLHMERFSKHSFPDEG